MSKTIILTPETKGMIADKLFRAWIEEAGIHLENDGMAEKISSLAQKTGLAPMAIFIYLLDVTKDVEKRILKKVQLELETPKKGGKGKKGRKSKKS